MAKLKAVVLVMMSKKLRKAVLFPRFVSHGHYPGYRALMVRDACTWGVWKLRIAIRHIAPTRTQGLSVGFDRYKNFPSH